MVRMDQGATFTIDETLYNFLSSFIVIAGY